jgi:hypothetical protein
MTTSGAFVLAVLAAYCLAGSTVNAWGGLFNRFNPSMLSNLGYGGHGGNYGRELYGVTDKNFGEVASSGIGLGSSGCQWYDYVSKLFCKTNSDFVLNYSNVRM